MGCTIYSLFTILEYNYWLTVTNNFILKTLHYFEKLWKWSSINWAVFNIIYPAFVFALNKKLWLKFRIHKTYTNIVSKTDTKTYGIWIKKYTKHFTQAEKSGELTKELVDEISNYTWRSFMHNLTWDWSKGWYIINTDWSKPFKCSIEVLRYMVEKDIAWTPMRTIVPNDTRTARIVAITLAMAKSEFKWIPYKILKKDYDIKNKVLQLYKYWK